MEAMLQLLIMPGVLLLAGAPMAQAESPMPDPIAPAVIGRPLEHIRPGRVARPNPMTVRPAPFAQAKPVPPRSAPAKAAEARAAAARAAAAKAVAAKRAAAQHAAARPKAPTAAVATAAAAAPHALAMPVAQEISPGQRAAKQTLDDRYDERVQLGEVGKGTHFARKPLAPGAFFGDRHRNAVHKYFEEHPVSARAADWRIGEPVPRGTRLSAVPRDLLPNLPDLPPGYRYAQLGGDVVMISDASKMVVDGISRSAR